MGGRIEGWLKYARGNSDRGYHGGQSRHAAQCLVRVSLFHVGIIERNQPLGAEPALMGG
jgi:hypothetical protein